MRTGRKHQTRQEKGVSECSAYHKICHELMVFLECPNCCTVFFGTLVAHTLGTTTENGNSSSARPCDWRRAFWSLPTTATIRKISTVDNQSPGQSKQESSPSRQTVTPSFDRPQLDLVKNTQPQGATFGCLPYARTPRRDRRVVLVSTSQTPHAAARGTAILATSGSAEEPVHSQRHPP